MGRLSIKESRELEQREGALGCLASTLVLMDLVTVRVKIASQNQPGILMPALEDLQHAARLVQRAQWTIHGLPLPCPALNEVENAAV